MKTSLQLSALCATLLLLSPANGQEQKAEPAPAAKAKPPADRATLEKGFEKTLNGATFIGRWSGVKEGKLGPEREERYTIAGARKVGGDVWLITARIQYGNTDATVPVPVNVHWAGDTAVIAITDLAIPGVGTYTARVMVHGNTYAGSWSGGEHGGLMSGIIQRSGE